MEPEPTNPVEQFSSRAPERFTAPENERPDRRTAPDQEAQPALYKRSRAEPVRNLCGILSWHHNALRQALHGERSAKVASTTIQLKPVAQVEGMEGSRDVLPDVVVSDASTMKVPQFLMLFLGSVFLSSHEWYVRFQALVG